MTWSTPTTARKAVVLLFVKEDFSRQKQGKPDNPEQNGRDAQKALKLKMTKNGNAFRPLRKELRLQG